MTAGKAAKRSRDQSQCKWSGTHGGRRGRPAPLLWVIRESLGLTGTKFGCGAGPVRPAPPSTSTARRSGRASRRVRRAAGKKVVTIEGLAPDLRPPASGRVDRGGRASMRLLPVGARIMAAAVLLRLRPAAHRCRYRRRHVRQPLPLPGRIRGSAGRSTRQPNWRPKAVCEMSEIVNVSRRDFLRTGLLAGGGLVLGLHLPSLRQGSQAAGSETGTVRAPTRSCGSGRTIL